MPPTHVHLAGTAGTVDPDTGGPAGCTVGPYATDGTRCGLPAVVGFVAHDGATFFECALHAA